MATAKKRTITVAIVADSKAFKKGMGDVEKTTQAVGIKVDALAKVFVAGLAIKAVGAVKDFAGDSIRAFSDLNESLNALDVSYGEHAEGIKRLGEEAATNLGLSNAKFNSFAVSLSAFAKQIAGDGGDVVGVVAELTTRVSDFASVMNLEVNEAALKFQSGLAGESEPLRKFGIDMSAAAVNAFALSTGLIEVGDKMDEATKVQARYGLLMKQTANTAGDFANTSDDLANSQRIVNARLEDSKARLGAVLAPAKAFFIELQGRGIDALSATFTWLGKLSGALDETVRALDAIDSAAAKGIDTTGQLGEGIGGLARELTAQLGVFGVETVKLQDEVDALHTALGERFGWDAYLNNLAKGRKELGLSQQEYDNWTQSATKAKEARDAEIESAFLAQQQHRRETGSRAALTESIDSQASALDDLVAAQQAAIDPALGLIRATGNAAKAQSDLNKARDDFGVGSPQFLEAAAKATEATLQQNAAQMLFNDVFGPQSEETFRMLLANSGLYGDELDLILDTLLRMATATRNLPPIPGSSGPDISQFHSGGVVPGPQGREQLAFVQGGETIRTPAQEAAVGRHGNGDGGGGVTINVNAGLITSPSRVAAEIDKVLTKRSRTNGLGFT